MEQICIRQAHYGDIDRVAVLFDSYRQFYVQKTNISAAAEFLRQRFEYGESVIFIAEQGEQAIGFVQLYPSFSSISMKRIYILNDLFVHPDARGRKIGGQLLSAAIEYAKSMKVARLVLSTAVSNVIAQGLYEGTGWVRDTEYYHYEYQLG